MALSENLSIGQITPNFSGKSLQGEVVFHEWLNNSWGVLMFYPGAFTPICTTEMCSLTKKHKVCHLTEYLKPSFITYTHQDNSLNATKETESKHVSRKMLSVANGQYLSTENWAPSSQGVYLTFIVKRIF